MHLRTVDSLANVNLSLPGLLKVVKKFDGEIAARFAPSTPSIIKYCSLYRAVVCTLEGYRPSSLTSNARHNHNNGSKNTCSRSPHLSQAPYYRLVRRPKSRSCGYRHSESN